MKPRRLDEYASVIEYGISLSLARPIQPCRPIPAESAVLECRYAAPEFDLADTDQIGFRRELPH
jgi:hypothetical protein